MSLTLGIIASSRGNIVPPLDTYGGAAAAYSTRLLSSAYGGSAVRVRRSFDNAEQDIGFSGGAINETALMNFVGYQNLVQRSEEFGDAYWNKLASSVSTNVTTDPFGTNNADSITETTANSAHEINTPNSFSFIVGQSYTFSAYAKQSVGTRNVVLYLGTSVSFGSSRIAIFSLSTGQCVYNDAGVQFNSIPLANGWWRFSITSVAISSTATIGAFIAMANGSTFPSSITYVGDGVSTFFIYGAQLNIGTSAQPYQVTTSAARSGDGFVTKWYTQDSNGENLLLQSQTFETANWNKFNSSIVADNTTAPDGTLTADKLNETAVTGQHGCVQNYTIPSANIYTFSIYVKAAERSTVNIVVYFNGGATDNFSARFNLSTGVVTSTSTGGAGVLISSTIQSVGSGWYRCSIIGNTTMSGSHSIQLGLLDAALNTNYLGVAGSGVFIWGAQLSQSTWLQPYQVTTTTAILRRDASQSTAANQPRIVGSGVIERENGKASIRFDGVDDFLTGTDIALPVWSIFSTAVQNVTNVTGYHTIYGRGTLSVSNSSRDALLYLNNVNKAVDSQRSDGTAFPTSRAYTFIQNYLVASGIYTGSQLTAFADSIAGASVSTTVTGSTNPTTLIGATAQSGTRDFYMGGEIGELIVYNSDRTATRADIERNIGAYYQTHWTGASSGLLDQFGGAAAAYSLRNLSSSYRGPLIRVRRSSDNAETDIGGTYNGDLDVASLVSFTGGQNLLTNSEDFTQTAWIKTGTTVTANATIAPDGTLTADKFNETAVNSGHSIGFNTSSLINGVNTISIYIKAAEVSKCLLTTYLSSSPYDYIACNIDLSTASIQLNYTGGAYSVISSSIQSVGNGWFRVSITGNITKGGSPHVFQFSLLNNSYQQAYLGTAGSGVYIWGAQLNTGILQPYIPTTTTAVNGANAFVTKWYTQDANYQNLVTFSEQFENAAWGKSNVVATPNTTTAPDGTLTADTIGISAGGYIRQLGKTVATSVVYTYSCYVKNNTIPAGTIFSLYSNNNVGGAGASNVSLLINIATGTASVNVLSAGTTVLASGLTSVGDGWYRAFFTFSTTVATATNAEIGLDSSSNCSFFAWGAQINEGTLVPYTSTTTTVSQRKDAIQATAANQPRIVNAGGVESEGNRPAVFWTDGTNMRLTASFQPIPSPQTFFAVNRIGATSGIQAATLFDSYENIQNVYYFRGLTEIPNNTFSYADVTPLSGPANPIPVQNITNVIHDTVVNVYDNNILTITGSVGTNSLSGLTIGGLRGNPSPIVAGYDWFGGIQELLVYPSNLATRLAVNSNINSYYRIYWQGNGTALLDSFSGASAAYSLRNLSSAYTGPLIRVRRSNDNVERDIYGTFGGDLDIASLVAFVGANSGFVTTWYDQSGNARHATQGTAANQPRIVNAGVVDTENGKPAIFFDGTNDQLIHTTPTPTASTPYSVHAVVSSLTQTSYRGVFSLGLATSQGGMMMLSRLGISPNWGTYNATSMDIPSTQNIQSAGIRLIEMYGSFAVGTHNFYTNGSSSGTYSDSEGQNVNSIGGVNSPTSQTFNGDISEIIYYNADRTASRIPIESNINNYYKIY